MQENNQTNQIAIPKNPLEISFFSRKDDVFEYRHDRPLRWLQKICFYILRKIKAFYLRHHQETAYQIVNSNDLSEKIISHIISVRNFQGKVPALIVIGREEFEALADCCIPRYLTLTLNNNYGRSMHSYDLQIGSQKFEVVVMPWLSGTIVFAELPEMFKRRKAWAKSI